MDCPLDNTPPHTAAAPALQKFIEENGMIRPSHPLYSPDLKPSDFYLFGYVKHCRREQSFEADDELFSSIEMVVRDIEKSTLNAVLHKPIAITSTVLTA
jgi:hypothetical protein